MRVKKRVTLEVGRNVKRKKQKEKKGKTRSAGSPCCVGFICVLVYLVGGVVAAVSVVGLHSLLWQRLRCLRRGCPGGGGGGGGVQRSCRSVRRRVSERVGRGLGSGPRTRKASMCQDYCEICRERSPACLKQPDSPNYQKKKCPPFCQLRGRYLLW